MAEGSKERVGVGLTDPDEDSPNMIVYRKASLTQTFFLFSFGWGRGHVSLLVKAHWSISDCIFALQSLAFKQVSSELSVSVTSQTGFTCPALKAWNQSSETAVLLNLVPSIFLTVIDWQSG